MIKVLLKNQLDIILSGLTKFKKVLNKFNIITNDVNTNFFLLNFNNCRYSANYIQKKLEIMELF